MSIGNNKTDIEIHETEMHFTNKQFVLSATGTVLFAIGICFAVFWNWHWNHNHGATMFGRNHRWH